MSFYFCTCDPQTNYECGGLGKGTCPDAVCITEKAARSFWADLMGTLWHNPDVKATHGTMSADHVARHMGITSEKANMLLWACVHFKLSDRQNGGFVV